MLERDQMLQTIRDAYAARVRGDVDGVLRYFADDAVFRLNAAPYNQITSVHAIDGGELRHALEQLIDNYEFSDYEIVDSVVEGSKAAIRSMFTVRAKKTGNMAQTEVLDLIEFRDGKICSFAQFFDTAFANNLMVAQEAQDTPLPMELTA
jgi:ketosteroid isomerase-like protein